MSAAAMPAYEQKLHTPPTFYRAIRAWLKAGVMDGPNLFPTEEGTPQGGVLSPLLANIALHGLETAIKSAFPRQVSHSDGRSEQAMGGANSGLPWWCGTLTIS